MASPTGMQRIQNGDAPFGDGRASYVLYLTNTVGDGIGIRLRPAESNKLHVVGFWTPGLPLK